VSIGFRHWRAGCESGKSSFKPAEKEKTPAGQIQIGVKGDSQAPDEKRHAIAITQTITK
jgi:hypothetical protein